LLAFEVSAAKTNVGNDGLLTLGRVQGLDSNPPASCVIGRYASD